MDTNNTAKRMKPREWWGYRIEVNDLVPEFARLVSRFDERGIPIDDTFGSSSDPPRPPKRIVLAWGPGAEAERVRMILDVLLDFQLSGVLLLTGDENRKRILVGSYVADDDDVTPMNTQLAGRLMDPALADSDFQRLAATGSKPRIVM